MRKKLLFALLLCFLFPAILYAQDTNPGLTSKPAYPNKINPSQFSVELKPGSSTTETEAIINNSTQPVTYLLVGLDSYTDEKNEVHFRASTDTQKEAGLWLVPEQKNVTLQAGETGLVNFSIIVPPSAKLGSYLGGLGVEIENIGTMQKNGMNVAVNIRKVDRVNIKVTDNPQPIEKMPLPGLSWVQIYFYASLGVFILAVLIIGIIQIKKRRAKKRAAHPDHDAEAHHATHPNHPSHPGEKK